MHPVKRILQIHVTPSDDMIGQLELVHGDDFSRQEIHDVIHKGERCVETEELEKQLGCPEQKITKKRTESRLTGYLGFSG